MSKKTLTEIKQMDWGNLKPSQIVAMYWLIERVQELEENIKEWEIVNESWEEINENLVKQNKLYHETLKLLVKQETLGKDIETNKTAVSLNGMIGLKGLGLYDSKKYIVYGVDEIIDGVMRDLNND